MVISGFNWLSSRAIGLAWQLPATTTFKIADLDNTA